MKLVDFLHEKLMDRGSGEVCDKGGGGDRYNERDLNLLNSQASFGWLPAS